MATVNSNSISGITTDSFTSDAVVNKNYVDNIYPSQTGNSGKFLITTDGVSVSWTKVSNYQEFTTVGVQTFSVPSYASMFYIEAVGAGGGGSAGTINTNSGAGGGSGSYTSWYVPKTIVTSSNINVIIGVGGTGGTSSGQSGSAGTGTTITWIGPGGTYTLIANNGGSAGTAAAAEDVTQSSYFYTTAGLSGAASATGIGITATSQVNQFQPTGGGSGGYISNPGGGCGSISVYGNTIFSAGGNNTGTSGSNATVINDIPYGYGGGGGGAGSSLAGNGGNGVRGGGGGGGGATSTNFGNGGNGGNGYVKITWW